MPGAPAAPPPAHPGNLLRAGQNRSVAFGAAARFSEHQLSATPTQKVAASAAVNAADDVGRPRREWNTAAEVGAEDESSSKGK